MEGLLIVLGGSGMLAFFFAIWLNTQKGKKWLSNLQCTFHWKLRGLWTHQVLVWQQKVVGWSVLSDALQFWLMYEKEIP